jgi:hypothetical protein
MTTNHLYYSPQWQVIEEQQNGTGTSNVMHQFVFGAERELSGMRCMPFLLPWAEGDQNRKD